MIDQARHSVAAARTSARYAELTRALVDASLMAGEHARLIVNGASMLPLLRSGDAVWVERVQHARLRCGDVIVLWRDGAFLTHRLARIDQDRVYTKGDHRRTFDPPSGLHDIVGRVTAIERDGRRTDVTGGGWGAVNRWCGAALRGELWALNRLGCTKYGSIRLFRGLAWLRQHMARRMIWGMLWFGDRRGDHA